MNPLRTIARDLVDRRLWPVAALLVALVIAVPVLFLRPAPAALDSSAPAAAPATPAATTAGAATTTTAPTVGTGTADVTLEPNVKLSTSPFAAAFGAGTSLPPSMEGLLKSTEGADHSAEVASAPLRDPFAAAAKSDGSSATSESGSAPASASSGGSSSPASTTTAPATGSPVIPSGTDTTQTLTPDTTTPVSPTPPSGSGTDAGTTPAADGTVFGANVSFGTTATAPTMQNAKRLTAFPSATSPIAVYLGIMRGGWGAVFALRDGTQPVGAPSCRPRKQICNWVILHQGESVTLNVKDDVTGAVTPYTLKLERITRKSLSSDAAKLANGQVSKDGRCLLGPLAAYRYDTETGTLAARPELQSCKYATPAENGQAASVRNVRIG